MILPLRFVRLTDHNGRDLTHAVMPEIFQQLYLSPPPAPVIFKKQISNRLTLLCISNFSSQVLKLIVKIFIRSHKLMSPPVVSQGKDETAMPKQQAARLLYRDIVK